MFIKLSGSYRVNCTSLIEANICLGVYTRVVIYWKWFLLYKPSFKENRNCFKQSTVRWYPKADLEKIWICKETFLTLQIVYSPPDPSEMYILISIDFLLFRFFYYHLCYFLFIVYSCFIFHIAFNIETDVYFLVFNFPIKQNLHSRITPLPPYPQPVPHNSKAYFSMDCTQLAMSISVCFIHYHWMKFGNSHYLVSQSILKTHSLYVSLVILYRSRLRSK